MAESSSHSSVLIGLGNRYRSDDAVGVLVAERIRDTNPEDVDVIVGAKDGTDIIEMWRGKELAIVIDSALMDADPGEIIRFEPIEDTIPEVLLKKSTTHLFSLSEVISLARTLEALPRRLIVYAVSARNFSHGENLLPDVSASIEKLHQLISIELSQPRIIDCQSRTRGIP